MHNMKRNYCRGMVYAMTNTENNMVIAFHRGYHGILAGMHAYETGGSGTNDAIVDPLASQGSLILSHNGGFLFAVNAGSNTISSFRANKFGALTLADVEPSNGTKPNSLAVFGKLLYVTNAGDPDNSIASNVTGFWVGPDGSLTSIAGSTSALSTSDAQPACINFSPDGKKLVVSELNNNRLSVFLVNPDGTLTGPVENDSSGGGPFGSIFLCRGILLVVEAISNAMSSYIVDDLGSLSVISGSVPNGQAATCWIAASINERFAFSSNTVSGTISTYHLKPDGTLNLTDIAYSTLEEIGAPIDSAVSRDGSNFYVLNGNQGSISVFGIGKNGELIRLQVFKDTGLPTVGAQGLAVIDPIW